MKARISGPHRDAEIDLHRWRKTNGYPKSEGDHLLKNRSTLKHRLGGFVDVAWNLIIGEPFWPFESPSGSSSSDFPQEGDMVHHLLLVGGGGRVHFWHLRVIWVAGSILFLECNLKCFSYPGCWKLNIHSDPWEIQWNSAVDIGYSKCFTKRANAFTTLTLWSIGIPFVLEMEESWSLLAGHTQISSPVHPAGIPPGPDPPRRHLGSLTFRLEVFGFRKIGL